MIRYISRAIAFTAVFYLPACQSLQPTNSNATSLSSYPQIARIQPITVENMTDQQKSFLGIIDGKPLPKRAKSNLFKTLVHHPKLMEVYDPMAYFVNTSPLINEKTRELIILRASWLYQGRYEWSQHYPKALAAGWSVQDIERIKRGADAAEWTDFEKTLLRSVDQLVAKASIDDDDWDALSKEYSTEQIMTLITLVTHYHWVAMMTKSMGIQPNLPVTAFDEPPK